MMAQSWTESIWEINDYVKYINQFPPNTMKSIRQYERINKKICKQKMSIMFHEICINEEMLPKYTYIHIFTPGQKYKTTLKNEENDIVYNFLIMKIRYMKDKA